ncbi:MAG: arginase family protein [Sphingomonas sp.]|nr:arginase family protein [Sphingomonas sp.]
MTLILAPSNLGLRPLRPGHIPGTWRAPEALVEAGLERLLSPVSVIELPRPPYSPDPQPGTRLRNGPEMRRFNLALADHVATAVARNQFAFVVGGDCSILLGALAGARRDRELSLAHIDGHSDFRHPGNYDPQSMLGAVAGMDLALATGRGEAIMAEWPEIESPLVRESRVIQIGERECRDPDFATPDVNETRITRIDIFAAQEEGIERTIARTNAILDGAGLSFWVHLDVDVLDQRDMPAVDSPGSPGLDPAHLVALLRGLLADQRALGLTLTVFDPDLDPDGCYARLIVDIVRGAVQPLRGS